MDSINNIFSGQGTDIVGALSAFGDAVNGFAESLGVSATVFYLFGAILSLFLGMFAYKIARLLTGLCAGLFAFFFFGDLLFYIALGIFKVELDNIICLAVSVVLAFVFFGIGFKRFKYVIFAVMAMVGYLVTVFYLSPYIDGVIVPITGAVVMALIAVISLRFAFAVATSFTFGFTLIYMLSCALPEVEVLNLQENTMALVIAGLVALFMLMSQLISTRHDYICENCGPRSKYGKQSGFVAGKKIRRKEIITEY